MPLENLLESASGTISSDLAILDVFFGFCFCVALSFTVRAFYFTYSLSLSGKRHIGSIIPVLSCVVFLVILVVKSSLALSLGLVGALSIVRFRTPIKEPEELVYLFLSIAVGLGCAAGHLLLTSGITLGILLIAYFWLSNNDQTKQVEYNLIVNWNNQEVSGDDVINGVSSSAATVKLIRLNLEPSQSSAIFAIELNDRQSISLISSEIVKLDPTASVSFLEANTNW